MGSGLSAISCCQRRTEAEGPSCTEYQPLLADRERQAVATLVKLFENDTRISFYEGEPLRALTVLARSDVHHLQLSAATAFSEISEFDVRAVTREALAPILYLLQSMYADVQQGASSALGNLAGVSENKRLIVELGGLELLVRQMLSPSTDAQINSVGCITNLAADEENKLAIARSGALVPLVRLGRSRDMRVQRNATGALLNMTHRAELRQMLVAAGAVTVLGELLQAKDEETLYYAITALSNIAVDSDGRDALWKAQAGLVAELLHIMQTRKIKVQAQVALTLRNLASDARYQLAIVQHGGLDALLPLLQSSYTALVVSAAACLRNLSIHADNEDPIICAGLLPELMDLVPQADQPELQCHAIATIRNLAANNGSDKQAFLDTGLFDRFQMTLEAKGVQPQVLCELAAAFSVFALNDQLWRPIVELGICRLLVQLLRCGHMDTEYNTCLALGSLVGKGHPEAAEELMRFWPRGLRKALLQALTLPEYAASNVRPGALWVIMALLNSRPTVVRKTLRSDAPILTAIESIGGSRVSSSSTCTSASWGLLPSIFGASTKPEDPDESTLNADNETAVVDDGFAPEVQRMHSLARQIVALVQDSD
ncbi:Vacuolar protein 8 [Coemansia sp. RSA 2706]|nr:Vacuolar protein 8 [Coemansia sp. RSA 2706]KAJ2370848.1 Vacuolar protein 8 [Coemansia sp. RSA 2610]